MEDDHFEISDIFEEALDDVAGPSRNINNPPPTKSAMEQLLQMQATSFGKEELTDAEIHVKERVFKVNKYFLCLHSDVFLAYLTSQYSIENKTGIIKIDDLDAVFVEAMLRFMYSGQVENLKEIAYDLYVVADRYNIKILKQICLENMFDNLNTTHIFNCLELAFQLNIEELKKKSIEFALKNASKIQEQPEWEPLIKRNPDISITLMKCLTKESEELKKKVAELEAHQCPHHRCHVNHRELLGRGVLDIDQFRDRNSNHRNPIEMQYRQELDRLRRMHEVRNNLNNGIENVRHQQRALRQAQVENNPAAEDEANVPNQNRFNQAALEEHRNRRAREFRRLMQMRRLMADEQEENGDEADLRVGRVRELDGRIERHQNHLAEIERIERRRRMAARLPHRRRNYPFEDENENNDNEWVEPNLIRRRNQENEDEPGPARIRAWHRRGEQNNQNNVVPPEPNQLQVIEISDNDEPVLAQQIFNLEDNSDDDFENAFLRVVQPPQDPQEQNEEIVVEGHDEDEGPNQVPQEPQEQPAANVQRPRYNLGIVANDDSSEDGNGEF